MSHVFFCQRRTFHNVCQTTDTIWHKKSKKLMLSLLSVGFHMLFSVVSEQCKFDRKLVWFIVPVIRFYSVSFRLRFSLHARSHFLRSSRKKHVRRHSRQIEKKSLCAFILLQYYFFLLVNWIFSIVHYLKNWFTWLFNLFELFERKLNFNKSAKLWFGRSVKNVNISIAS